MLNNPNKLLFFLSLMSGTLISISANSWLSAWMGLEINLLSFIPIMSSSKNLMTTEASLKYFLTQALASATLLFTVILSASIIGISNSLWLTNPLTIILINSSLLLKMGAAPLHFWFPGVMEGLNWMNSLVLMTWQKIAPLILISYNLTMNLFTTIIIVSSVIIGSIGGLNQTSLRKMLAYSSINHLGWLISALTMGENLWNLYFLIYTFLTSSIVFMLNSFKIFHINQMFSMNFTPPIIKFSLLITLLSLGGLPPFIGFLPKWTIIQAMASMNLHLIITLMVIMTLITLYYYLRTSFSAFMLTYSETLWNHDFKSSKYQSVSLILSMISTTGLILTSIMLNIL
uniref:NADH dehydrogenase subunit 2 n=1 Tax=Peltoperlopsis sagittata TaxID=2969800 RepID=UPI002176C873|nr:NADH dehydrogenase subunit 2 [Peltoperlopsis sagittata]UUK29385.1 NADH dehydrogenase subunit 2 [Peltoperlopsis sagittata]